MVGGAWGRIWDHGWWCRVLISFICTQGWTASVELRGGWVLGGGRQKSKACRNDAPPPSSQKLWTTAVGPHQSVNLWQAFFQRQAVHHMSRFSIPYTLRHFFPSPRTFRLGREDVAQFLFLFWIYRHQKCPKKHCVDSAVTHVWIKAHHTTKETLLLR